MDGIRQRSLLQPLLTALFAVLLGLLATGLLATCLQHEIDHLNGVLFIDHISKLKRDMVVKKFTKLAKQRGGAKQPA